MITVAYQMKVLCCEISEFHEHLSYEIWFMIKMVASLLTVSKNTNVYLPASKRYIYNSLTHQGDVAVILNLQFSNSYQEGISWVFPVKLPYGECQKLHRWLVTIGTAIITKGLCSMIPYSVTASQWVIRVICDTWLNTIWHLNILNICPDS